MKNILFAIATSTLLALVSGCNQSACTDVNCLNGGECNHGSCVCPEGYSGEYCENEGEDPCENVNCLNGGVCVDGTCECPNGFTGPNCQYEVGSTFIGSYSVSQSCSSSPTTSFSITITAGTISDQVIVTNFGNDGNDVIGIANGNNLSVPSQTVNGFTYTGTGFLDGSVLQISYNVSFTGGGESCNMTGILQ